MENFGLAGVRPRVNDGFKGSFSRSMEIVETELDESFVVWALVSEDIAGQSLGLEVVSGTSDFSTSFPKVFPSGLSLKSRRWVNRLGTPATDIDFNIGRCSKVRVM